MKGLPFVGLVNARVRIAARLPQVFDMAERVAFRVLGSCGADVGSDSEEGDGGFELRPTLDGQASNKREAAAVERIVQDSPKARAERGQREINAPDGGDVYARVGQWLRRPLDLGYFGSRTRLDPVARSGPLRAVPCGRPQDFGRQSEKRICHTSSPIIESVPRAVTSETLSIDLFIEPHSLPLAVLIRRKPQVEK